MHDKVNLSIHAYIYILIIFQKRIYCIAYTARALAALLGRTPEREQAVKEVIFLLNIQNNELEENQKWRACSALCIQDTQRPRGKEEDLESETRKQGDPQRRGQKNKALKLGENVLP